MSKTELEKLVKTIGNLYPAGNIETPSNGHEVSHINGVLMRAEEMADKINEHPQAYGLKEGLDKDVVMISAALHDIGNVFDDGRDSHNVLAKGVIDGKLELSTIIASNADYSKEVRQACIDVVNGQDPYRNIQFSESQQEKEFEFFREQMSRCLKEAVRTKEIFDNAYYTPEERNNQSETKVAQFIFDRVHEVQKQLYTEYNPANASFNKTRAQALHEITQSVQRLYPPNSKEFSDISMAVIEHNMDFSEGGIINPQRHVSSHITSRIVADADKDNCAQTFAVRTIAYAAAGWKFRNTDNTIDKERCCQHVLDQAAERFQKSGEQLPDRTYTQAPFFIESVKNPIHKETLKEFAEKYNRPDLNPFLPENTDKFKSLDSKLVDAANKGKESPDDYVCFKNGYKAASKVKGAISYKGITKSSNNKRLDKTEVFITRIDGSDRAGDDIFSSLDKASGQTEISALREEALSSLQKWAETKPEVRAAHQEEVGKIFDLMIAVEKKLNPDKDVQEFSSATTEGVIQLFESTQYPDLTKTDHTIDSIFSEIETNGPNALANEVIANLETQSQNPTALEWNNITTYLIDKHEKEQTIDEIELLDNLDAPVEQITSRKISDFIQEATEGIKEEPTLSSYSSRAIINDIIRD